MPRGREGGSGTFGTHKPRSRAGVQHGMGYIVREGAGKAKEPDHGELPEPGEGAQMLRWG